jgi:kynurenine formamidase
MTDLERSDAELRDATRVFAKRIHKLNFGCREDPMLSLLRRGMARDETARFERHAEQLAEEEWNRVQSIPQRRESAARVGAHPSISRRSFRRTAEARKRHFAYGAQCDNRTMRLIDLSVPLQHDAPSEPLPAKIHYVTHEAEGLTQMQQFFGVRVEDLVWSGGKGWAVEEIHAITHTGTHVDAPYHYGPQSEGKPARRIDDVPLEWCYAPGVILDVRSLPAGVEITVDFLRQALERIGYSLQPLDIVLLQTGCDQRIQSREYFAQPGLGREGTLWLVEQTSQEYFNYFERVGQKTEHEPLLRIPPECKKRDLVHAKVPPIPPKPTA